MIRIVALLCLAAPALAQEPDDTALRLDVCRGIRAGFLGDIETFQMKLRQDAVTIDDLKKRLAEAEAKAPPDPIDPKDSR